MSLSHLLSDFFVKMLKKIIIFLFFDANHFINFSLKDH